MLSNQRVDYIDLMKGLTILWIIWVHTDHPDFEYYRTPVFFFINGIFFKLADANTFFSKKLRTLIIPFFFFYLICIPLSCLLEMVELRTLDISILDRFTSLFTVEKGIEGFRVNPPLWFLPALFWLNVFGFVLFRMPRWAIFTLMCVSFCFYTDMTGSFSSPLALNNAMAWFGFFALGFLTGKPIIGFLDTGKRKATVFSISLLVFGLLLIYGYMDLPDWRWLVWQLKLIAFIICYMSFFSFFDGWKKLEILRFFGKNSIIVLGGHYWIVRAIARVFTSLTGMQSIWLGLLASIITAALLIPIILFINRKAPYLVGKKRLMPSTQI